MAVQAVGEAQRILEEYLQPQPTNYPRQIGGSSRTARFVSGGQPIEATKLSGSPQMTKQIPIALAACIATLSAIGMPPAQAKQQCSAAAPSNPHGQWWSYRLIDGRKCWYQGKLMLSKSLLEWPKEASMQPVSSGKVTSVVRQNLGNPLGAQARVLTDSDTFEARWRDRVDVQ
jgi:hypothetical protein